MKPIEIPIGNLVAKCATWNPKKSGEGTFDYIDLSSVDKDSKSIIVVERHSCIEAPSRARQRVKEGDILVATVRPNLNGVALVGKEHDSMTASTGYCVLRPIPERLESRFLFHWVKTHVFVQRMVDVATGANYPAVSDAKVKGSTIPLPPLAEQKRIATILDAADALRAKRSETLAQLDTLLQSTFLDMFGDPVTNSMGWDIKKLKDLVTKLGDGLHGTPQYSDDGHYFFINGNNLCDGRIRIDESTKRVDKEEYLKHKKEINDTTMFVSINGTIGKVAFYNGEDIVLGKSACYFNLRQGQIISEFLYHQISSQYFLRYAKGQATGSTIKNVSLKTMRSFPVLYSIRP